MADERARPDAFTGSVQPWIAQLRRLTDEIARTAGLPEPAAGHRPLAGLPRPGALSAAQLSAVTSAVAAQRASIAGLRAQLDSFDEQLGVLEAILAPLAEWSKTWADVEGLLSAPLGDQESDG